MVSQYSEAFAQNLISLMRERGITQHELASAVDIPQQTLWRYIKCKREVSLEYLCRIADYFGEDVDVLIGRRDY